MTTVSTNTDRSDRSPGVSELFDVLERLHIAEERPDAEIAAELGITTQRLRRWFQKPGELTFDNLIDLSVAFGMGKFELIELWCQQMDDAREIREAMS